MTVVKICGLTNLADALWAWQCGADLLGFILVPSSKRYVPAPDAAEIVQALNRDGCTARYVGVFAEPDLCLVNERVARCGFHYAQLHGLEKGQSLDDLRVPGIVAHRVQKAVDWDALTHIPAWAYLLDSYKPGQMGGTGETWQWDLIQEGRLMEQRIILAGGLSPANVGQAIRQVHPWGVDVATGVEAAPGRKDAGKVAEFISLAREEDRS